PEAEDLRNVATTLCFIEPPRVESGTLVLSFAQARFENEEELPFQPERLEVPFDAERIPTVEDATPCWDYVAN
ncbi:MAG TPA: hypothetical protein RMG48_04975, partial [Myxococcales bacterium LLY-WYZ-16_1]|nr:hypothetical protein [Myxococcales bacterium LLY-WYZ-16_1]